MNSKLVPVVPTEAMIDAALRLQGEDAFFAKAPALMSALFKIYTAMVKASPAPDGEVVAVLTVAKFRGHLENTSFDHVGNLPDGTYRLYTAPPRVADGIRDAAERVIKAFSAYGNESNKLAGMQRHRECEESMVALKAALDQP